MEKYKSLEYITRGFQAAHKIQNVYQSSTRQGADSANRQSSDAMISEILRIIAEHSPEPHRKKLGSTIDTCELCQNTYRNLKQHLQSPGNTRGSSHKVMKSLDIIKPITGSRQRVLIEKLLKIYEIIMS